MYRQAARVHVLSLDRAYLCKLMGGICRRRERALHAQYQQFKEVMKDKSDFQFGEFMVSRITTTTTCYSMLTYDMLTYADVLTWASRFDVTSLSICTGFKSQKEAEAWCVCGGPS